MSEDITIVALLHAKPGAEQQVAQAMQACVAPSRLEAGNLSYVPQQDQNDARMFMFVEHWDSHKSFEQHLETPHFKALIAAVQDLLVTPPAVHVLKPLAAH
ncbi:putative quinol monooxygenase [Acetobacter farinalis]|uniref:Quinol monooxygenase n=1 Tax=Acetobacter farinalis TaxID=1260984 RepID=A0ABT3Q939_9PROT|nr:putative quinol monooxygenase [Acetobacter farinalis]MCX2561813.1 putative quinol monooxygenase [Acetobacter farinalis]NHO30269.1 antibiotic biosynthesis monooxygenase [Acetobacter farinalis]